MKGGESSMEQTEILLAIQQQMVMLQNTIDTLREQSRQKDEEIERLRQIILNLQRAQFGQRSEKRKYVLDDGNQQLSLFDTLEKIEDVLQARTDRDLDYYNNRWIKTKSKGLPSAIHTDNKPFLLRDLSFVHTCPTFGGERGQIVHHCSLFCIQLF